MFIRYLFILYIIFNYNFSFAFSESQCYSLNAGLPVAIADFQPSISGYAVNPSGVNIKTSFRGCIYEYLNDYFVVIDDSIWDYNFIPNGSSKHSFRFLVNDGYPPFSDVYYNQRVGYPRVSNVNCCGHFILPSLNVVSTTPVVKQPSFDPVNNVLDSFLLKAHNFNVDYGSYLVDGLVSATRPSSFVYNLHNHILPNSEMISLISAISSSSVSYYPGLRSSPVTLFSDSSSLLPINFSNSVYTPPADGLSSNGSSIGITSAGSFIPVGADQYSSNDGGGWTSYGGGSFDFLPAYSDAIPEPFVIAGLNGLVGSPLSSSVIGLTSTGNFVALTFFPDCCFVSTVSYFVPVSIFDGSISSLSVYVSRAYSSANSFVILKTLVSVADSFTNGRSSVSSDSFKVIVLNNAGVSGVGAVLGVFDPSSLSPSTSPAAVASSPSTAASGGVPVIPSSPASGGVNSNNGCVSNCATESTQVLNSDFLSRISNYFSAPSASANLPDSKTGADVKGAGLNKDSASFSQLLGFRLPSHSSVCPVSSFQWSGSTYVFDAHCKLVTDNFDVLRSVMTAMFSLSALFVVLKA